MSSQMVHLVVFGLLMRLCVAYGKLEPLARHMPLHTLGPSEENQNTHSLRNDAASRTEQLTELCTLENGEQELHVSGSLHQVFVDQGAILTVIYEAGKNGYVAKYKYNVVRLPTPDGGFPLFASAGFLKTAAG